MKLGFDATRPDLVLADDAHQDSAVAPALVLIEPPFDREVVGREFLLRPDVSDW